MPKQPQPAPFDGALVIDKPKGKTSHDVVDAVRHLAGFRQIGHLGTLDPLATGVLVLLLGRATRSTDASGFLCEESERSTGVRASSKEAARRAEVRGGRIIRVQIERGGGQRRAFCHRMLIGNLYSLVSARNGTEARMWRAPRGN